MKILLFLILLVKSFGRLALTSTECLIYLGKLEKLAFQKNLQIVPNDNDINVTFGYTDALFNNDTYWGLTTDDGKLKNSTCLDLKIWIFKSESYQDLLFNGNPEVQIQGTDPVENQRYLSFTIQLSYFLKNRFLELDPCTVYFGVIYYAAGTNQILKSQKFSFSFKFNPESISRIPTSFKKLQFEPTFTWCTDLLCKEIFELSQLTINKVYVARISFLYINDQYFEPSLYLFGNGATALIKPQRIIYSSSFVIFQFTFNTIFNYGTLQMNISSESQNEKEIVIKTIQLPCIKKDQDQECPTCQDQCRINNGNVEKQCDCATLETYENWLTIFPIILLIL